jgi:hypothetical protein
MRGSLQVIGACLFITGCIGNGAYADNSRCHGQDLVDDFDPDEDVKLLEDGTLASPASIAAHVDRHSFAGDQIGEEVAPFRINLRVSPPKNVRGVILDGSADGCDLGAILDMDVIIEIDFEDGPDVTLLGTLTIEEMTRWEVVSYLDPGDCDRVFCTALGIYTRFDIRQEDGTQATLGMVEGYDLPVSNPARRVRISPLLVTVAPHANVAPGEE